jgi:membrane-bound lytic murein transglycosylase D
MVLPFVHAFTTLSSSGGTGVQISSLFFLSGKGAGAPLLNLSGYSGTGRSFDLPVSLSNSVENYVEYFRTDGRDILQGWLDRSTRYDRIVKSILREKNLPAELAYLPMIESGFDLNAVSPADAAGLWQLVPDTARRYGLRVDPWVDERRDPVKSTRAAAAHLSSLYKLFGSWPLALASYNAGETRVKRAVLRTTSPEVWRVRTPRYLPRETRNYVPKYLAAVVIAADPERYGFTPPPPAAFSFDEVVVPQRTDLRLIARCAGVDVKDIRDLNPELLRGFTPPDVTHYAVRLPRGTRELLPFACTALAPKQEAIPATGIFGMIVRLNTANRPRRSLPPASAVGPQTALAVQAPQSR